MNDSRLPNVAILLAAHNGEKYIEEQIKSILSQKKVNVTIYISIDNSKDKTLEICQDFKKLNNNISIINCGELSFGSAGKNFYFLIKNVNFDEFDYIAFSDQDDIWKSSKLIRGIDFLKKEKYIAYSSDVECFWDDGKKKNKIIKKSYPQKKYDYLLEPAGPGCTYILRRDFAKSFKEKIINSPHLPFHHDWAMYAYARKMNLNWFIDKEPNIYYRQHSNNQVGANHGMRQYLKRIEKLKNGGFRRECQEIMIFIGDIFILRERILENPFLYRRNPREAVIIYIFCLFGWI